MGFVIIVIVSFLRMLREFVGYNSDIATEPNVELCLLKCPQFSYYRFLLQASAQISFQQQKCFYKQELYHDMYSST